MKADPIFIHEKSGTKGRVIAKHTYPELPPEVATYASVKGPTGTTWLPFGELRVATAEETEAFKKAA